MKKTVLSVLALSALVFSCKKDDDKSNAEKIQGKWNLIRMIDNDHYSNVDHKDTTDYPSGSYTVEFQSSGIAIEKTANFTDSSHYTVDGSRLIFKYSNNSDTVNITTLTGSDLQVSAKEVYTGGDFYEHVSILKK